MKIYKHISDLSFCTLFQTHGWKGVSGIHSAANTFHFKGKQCQTKHIKLLYWAKSQQLHTGSHFDSMQCRVLTLPPQPSLFWKKRLDCQTNTPTINLINKKTNYGTKTEEPPPNAGLTSDVCFCKCVFVTIAPPTFVQSSPSTESCSQHEQRPLLVLSDYIQMFKSGTE